jgi:hypothetical protein
MYWERRKKIRGFMIEQLTINFNSPSETKEERKKRSHREYQKKWRLNNKKYAKNYYENQKEKWHNYYENNKEIISQKGKEYRNKNKNRIKKYKKEWYRKVKQTKIGLITIIYAGQIDSCNRIPKRILLNHKVNYSLDELKEWCLENKNFNQIFQTWQDSNFNLNLMPSIDRINHLDDYNLDNICACTWKENYEKSHKEFTEWYKIKKAFKQNQIL